jgi:hypothetical protein
MTWSKIRDIWRQSVPSQPLPSTSGRGSCRGICLGTPSIMGRSSMKAGCPASRRPVEGSVAGIVTPMDVYTGRVRMWRGGLRFSLSVAALSSGAPVMSSDRSAPPSEVVSAHPLQGRTRIFRAPEPRWGHSQGRFSHKRSNIVRRRCGSRLQKPKPFWTACLIANVRRGTRSGRSKLRSGPVFNDGIWPISVCRSATYPIQITPANRLRGATISNTHQVSEQSSSRRLRDQFGRGVRGGG